MVEPEKAQIFNLPVWPDQENYLQPHSGKTPPRHVHIIPSLNLGGAERIVCDLARQWRRLNIPVDVLVMRDSTSGYDVTGYDSGDSSVRFHRLGEMSWGERTARAAQVIRASDLPAYAHLTSLKELEDLWSHGCRTVPVVHNVALGWREAPAPWNVPSVPFVVACGELVARQLAQTRLEKPVRVLRHVLPSIRTMADERRRAVRSALGAGDTTILIGMVGRMAHQKRYTRAVAILATLVARGVDARLVIIGAANGDEGYSARNAVLDAATRLGVSNRLCLPGPLPDATLVLGAFDVFLNASVFEGVSIATMEAAAAGVPIVSADVGGQFEAVPPGEMLLPADADDAAYATALIAAAVRGIRSPADRSQNWLAPVAAQTWAWMAALGPKAMLADQKPDRLLFVTANLDVGGAQRSLCNLAAELARQGHDVTVAVCGPVGVPGFMTDALASGACFVSLEQAGQGLAERIGRVLSLVYSLAPACLCFWNMDSPAKIGIAKVLADGPVRIADASPGPLLYTELDNSAALAKILSSSPDDYLGSLDLLGAKYEGGLPGRGRRSPKAAAVIRNGVPITSGDGLLGPTEGPRPPAGADPDRALVCVCRLAASKHLELLPAIARHLADLVPGATLTVVGGVHGTSYHASVVETALSSAVAASRPTNLHFAGPDHRTAGFLPRFAALLMVSEHQGCPNTSLEALAAGIPVIANDDGGTAEQVIDGVTGHLLPSAPWETLAERLAAAAAAVLRSPQRAIEMGRAGQDHVSVNFSMAVMAREWSRALIGAKASPDILPWNGSISNAGADEPAGLKLTSTLCPN